MTDEEIPASPGVERLWLLDQLGLRSAYNVPVVWRVDSPVGTADVRAALDTLAARHPMLRAALRATGAGLRFQVSATVRLPVEEVRVAGDGRPSGAVLSDFAGRPFDLRRPPLARALVIVGGTGGTVVALVLHHCVADGASVAVLQAEFAALLTAQPVPEQTQESDLAALRRIAQRQLAIDAHDPGVGWWRSLLSGLPHCAMPLDRPRPAQPSGRGRRVAAPLPAASAEALRRLAAEHRCPPFAVGLAAAHLLVARFTANARPVVASVVANRPDRDSARLVGFLANTIALPADLTDPALCFAQLVAATRRTLFDALEYQDIPFDRVVSALSCEREPNRNPVSEVVFVMPEPAVFPAALAPVAIGYEPAKFDLTLSLSLPTDTAGGEIGALFAEDVLDEVSARRIVEAFRDLLCSALADPAAPVLGLPMTQTPDSPSLLVPPARPGTARVPRPVHERFALQAARTPEAVAVVDRRESVTYRELDQRSDALAWYLRGRGVALGDVVALRLPNGLGLVASMLAVWKAGAVVLPVDPDLPEARVRAMLEDSAAVLAVDGRALAEAVLPAAPAGALPAGADPADLAYVLFTSGSTGRPKAVAVSHASLAGFCDAVARTVPQETPVGALASPSFDISLVETIAPLTIGRTVVAADRHSDWPALFGDVGWLQLTPSHARLLLRDTAALGVLRRLDTLVLVGERVTPDLAEKITALVPGKVFNCYGPTEATVWATAQELTAGTNEVVPIGRPLPNTTAGVFDERGVPVPRGAIGEICLGGTGIAAGYLGRPGLTADLFRPDPHGAPGSRLYRTGDVARVRPDRVLEYLGRRDTQLKVRGHRVEAGEVEAALNALDGVTAAAVGVNASAGGEQILVAHVVTDQPAHADTDRRIRAALARSLPTALIPSVIVFPDRLPVTASGKVDRDALARLPLPSRGERTRRTAGNAVERELAGLWAGVTGVDAPDPDAHFFDIGGSSLLLVRFHALIGERFPGAALTIIDLFVATTLAATAQTVAERAGLNDPEPTMDFAV